jgi:hypothetical protein
MGVDYNLTSTPEKSPTHLPWATLFQSRLYPLSQGLWIWPWFDSLERHWLKELRHKWLSSRSILNSWKFMSFSSVRRHFLCIHIHVTHVKIIHKHLSEETARVPLYCRSSVICLPRISVQFICNQCILYLPDKTWVPINILPKKMIPLAFTYMYEVVLIPEWLRVTKFQSQPKIDIFSVKIIKI